MSTMAKRQSLSERIKYYDLCQVLNDIKNNKKDEKRRSFDKFLARWYDEMVKFNDDGTKEYYTEDSFYPAMRLIVPMEDKSRKYGLGVTKLTQMLAKGLAIPTNSQELKELQKLNEENAALGLAQFVVKRTGKKEPNLSIAEVNDMLDHLAADMNDGDGKKDTMQKLLKSCTFDELYWIFLILTKKIEITLGTNFGMYVIKWFHPGCYEKLHAGASLQEVIDEVCSASIEERPIDVSQILCRKIKPMLLKRLTHKLSDFKKIIKICGRPFYVETKFDGEHLLVHKYGPDGCKYNYFTRNQNDYTNKFGADCQTKLSARIHDFFKKNVRNCILDCEVLIWDNVFKKYVGKNQRASDGKIYDVKNLEEDAFGADSPLERCLAVFDLLYLNDKSFIDTTLEERMGILNHCVFEKEEPSVIFVSKKLSISNREEFKNFYNDSMRAGHEGIVIKGLNSKYKMGSRAERNGWFKIKPDYGNLTNLDLAIAAARVDKNGKIETFYVAAKDGPKTSKLDMRFRIMAPLMSSMKKVDFDHLLNLVHGEKGWLPLNEKPYWITNPNLERHQNRRYVRREQMVVVEVRASGVKDGNLQFPRIVEIRQDKNLEEIDTASGVFKHEDKLRERHSDGSEDERITEPSKKRRRELLIHENYKLVKHGIDSTFLSSGLKGRKVCVLQGDNKTSPQQFQEILISLGAEPVANPSRTTDFLIATNPKHVRVAGAIKQNSMHIVHGDWLLKCKEAGKLLSWYFIILLL
uniref:DNA ligase IV n=2 Tax=Acrobeloides nanus TaxID=290746 RepID=A0A914EFR0_9BILA